MLIFILIFWVEQEIARPQSDEGECRGLMWHYFNGAMLTHLDILKRANRLRKNLKRGISKSKLERKSASSDRVLVSVPIV